MNVVLVSSSKQQDNTHHFAVPCLGRGHQPPGHTLQCWTYWAWVNAWPISVEVVDEGRARQVVDVEVFLFYHRAFPGEVGRRLEEENRVRSESFQVEGSILNDTQRSSSEHDIPPM